MRERDDKDQFCLEEPEKASVKKTAWWARVDKQDKNKRE